MANKHIFLSYARADGIELAKTLHRDLTQRHYDVFWDQPSIKGGDAWITVIESNILKSSHLILILTPQSLISEWCIKEWQLAERNHIKVIPVLYRGNAPTGFVGNLNYIDFRRKDDFTHSFQQLLEALEASDGDKSQADWCDMSIMEIAVSEEKLGCISPNASLNEAFFRIAEEAKYKYRHLIVTETGENHTPLIGIISLRSILKETDRRNKTVHDVMDYYDREPSYYPTFASIRATDTLGTALRAFTRPLFKDLGVRHFYYMSAIPIVDADHNAISIVSFKDIIREMRPGGRIPIPNGSVAQYMQHSSSIYIGDQIDSIPDAKTAMIEIGQRDAPVVNNLRDSHLLGFVPDNVMIDNYHTHCKIGDIIVPFYHLKLQGLYTPLSTVVDFLRTKEAKMYYSFPVVLDPDNKESPQSLLGIISYRDIFRALLQDCG